MRKLPKTKFAFWLFAGVMVGAVGGFAMASDAKPAPAKEAPAVQAQADVQRVAL